jgi:hypothetical protein
MFFRRSESPASSTVIIDTRKNLPHAVPKSEFATHAKTTSQQRVSSRVQPQLTAFERKHRYFSKLAVILNFALAQLNAVCERRDLRATRSGFTGAMFDETITNFARPCRNCFMLDL